jgi:hypothetical protein
MGRSRHLCSPAQTFFRSSLIRRSTSPSAGRKSLRACKPQNSNTTKKVKSLAGEFELESSRDRSGSFEPVILPKRQVVITEELEDKVIGLYALGLSPVYGQDSSLAKLTKAGAGHFFHS